MPIYPNTKSDPPNKNKAVNPILLKAIEGAELRKKQGPFIGTPTQNILAEVNKGAEERRKTGSSIGSAPYKPYNPVDSGFADVVRSALPVPKNVAQAVAKTVFGDARMSNNSLSDQDKVVLWNTIQNAKKRTGKDRGGTEYADYGKQGWGDSEDFNQWFNRGENTLVGGAVRSLTNPGFKMASTVGRGVYKTDPNDPNTVHYTDNYNWNQNEKNFSGKNFYQIIRNFVRNTENTSGDQSKFDMNFTLSKSDIEKIKAKQEYVNSGPQFGRYAGMLYPKLK
jgi:hypothetical protein